MEVRSTGMQNRLELMNVLIFFQASSAAADLLKRQLIITLSKDKLNIDRAQRTYDCLDRMEICTSSTYGAQYGAPHSNLFFLDYNLAESA